MFGTVIDVMGIVGTVLALLLAGWKVYELLLSRSIKRGARSSLPFRLRSPITYS